MKVTKKFRLGAAFALILALAMVLACTACSKGYDIEFGASGSNATFINIKNETGSEISAIEFTKDETVTEISKSLMDASTKWESDKTAKIGYEDMKTPTVLVKVGSKTYVMHNLNIATIEKASLKLEGDYAYLEYEKDGQRVSTLDDEKAYVKAQQEKKEAEEKAKAEAEAKAKAEEEAKKKAEEEAKAAEEAAAAAAAEEAAAAAAQSASSGYSGSSSAGSSSDYSSSSSSSGSSSAGTSSSAGSSSGSGSVSQSTDGCIPDFG